MKLTIVDTIVTEVEIACTLCNESKIVKLDASMTVFQQWCERDISAQDAFPEVSADDRELLISNTCSTCFDKMFPEEKEDESDQTEILAAVEISHESNE